MTPDESLPVKQTVVFLNFICDFNVTWGLSQLRIMIIASSKSDSFSPVLLNTAKDDKGLAKLRKRTRKDFKLIY